MRHHRALLAALRVLLLIAVACTVVAHPPAQEIAIDLFTEPKELLRTGRRARRRGEIPIAFDPEDDFEPQVDADELIRLCTYLPDWTDEEVAELSAVVNRAHDRPPERPKRAPRRMDARVAR